MTREGEPKGEEKKKDEIETAIFEIRDPPKLEIGDHLLNTLGTEAEDILENNFVNSKDLEEKTIE